MKPSLDPIFYANEAEQVGGLPELFYYNSDPRARPFACVDTTELCSPDGKTCWSMTSPIPYGLTSTPDYWLMKWSLENSNIYDSIKWRLGTALKAQESISQSVSRPLSPFQWQIEANQLFATSLARIQFDAWDIAAGADRGRPGYIEATPDEAKGQLCGLFKFKTSDYTNVNLAAFIGIILLAFTLFFLTWNPNTIGVKSGLGNSGQLDSKLLIVDLIVGAFIYAGLEGYNWVSSQSQSLFMWMKHRKTPSHRTRGLSNGQVAS